jgi:hypothetical protein
LELLNTPVSWPALAAAICADTAPVEVTGLAAAAAPFCMAAPNRVSWPAFSCSVILEMRVSMKAGALPWPRPSARPIGTWESRATLPVASSICRRVIPRLVMPDPLAIA